MQIATDAVTDNTDIKVHFQFKVDTLNIQYT